MRHRSTASYSINEQPIIEEQENESEDSEIEKVYDRKDTLFTFNK